MTPDITATDLVTQLIQRGLTIATAESLTAGMVSSTLADISGASATLSGGVVAYSNTVKHRVLGVSEETLAQRGAVDEETARQMASGVRQLMQTDIGVSTTGVAGPESSEGKAVGVVFIAIASADTVCARQLQFDGSRQEIRRATVAAVFQLVAEWLAPRD